MDAEPQRSALEYVTRLALPLSANSSAAMLGNAMAQLAPATVSTHSFDEDAVAGLEDALALDWSQGCGLRTIFLVTDAGALQSDDTKSRHPGIGLSTMAARARDLHIDIFPVHVQTREAKEAGDVDKAAEQYRIQLNTEPGGQPNYRAIANGSTAGFNDYLAQVGKVIDRLGEEARNRPVTKPTAPASPGQAESVANLVYSKLFAVQQRFLGAMANAAAPTFASSWTSDRDLGNLDLPALEVSVYLTRQQLNQLAEKTSSLILNARQAKTESSRFFGLLRMVSAATAQDPQRFANDSANLSAFMPSFLSVLPYKSEVLSLNAEDWRAMGPARQDAFLSRLVQKLSYYRQLEADQSLWVTLGGSDATEQVALLPLSQMP
jgi:hypothetical protein